MDSCPGASPQTFMMLLKAEQRTISALLNSRSLQQSQAGDASCLPKSRHPPEGCGIQQRQRQPTFEDMDRANGESRQQQQETAEAEPQQHQQAQPQERVPPQRASPTGNVSSGHDYGHGDIAQVKARMEELVFLLTNQVSLTKSLYAEQTQPSAQDYFNLTQSIPAQTQSNVEAVEKFTSVLTALEARVSSWETTYLHEILARLPANPVQQTTGPVPMTPNSSRRVVTPGEQPQLHRLHRPTPHHLLCQ